MSDTVRITVPADFSSTAERKFYRAGYRDGFKGVKVISPTLKYGKCAKAFIRGYDAGFKAAGLHEVKPLKWAGRRYRDGMGRILCVSCLHFRDSWGTYYRAPHWGSMRTYESDLPLRPTREKAQADLDRWAKEKGLEEVVD